MVYWEKTWGASGAGLHAPLSLLESMAMDCNHQWKILHEAQCSFEFTEAVCELCGKELLEGGLMDSLCLEDPEELQ